MMQPLVKKLYDVTIATDEEGWPGFLLMLRAGNGFNQEKFDCMCTILEECAYAWKDSDVVPKIAAHILGALVPDMLDLANAIDDDENQKILDSAPIVYHLVEECLKIPQ
jgi:hypothetical protein